LEDLEAAPAADHHDVPVQRQPSLHEGPAHELVYGVVAAHVLSQCEQLAFGVEERGRVEASGRAEDRLGRPQLLSSVKSRISRGSSVAS